ncbi:hypothetical protein EV174_004306 [Coemansia sp. RSA 2320]|nr:hypothetical protein EV174_004306 [Coemansia sp. RSA 2320]
MTAADISVSSTHRHGHGHNMHHSGDSAMAMSRRDLSPRSHEYSDAGQSPVPSLTNATLRSSSVSSSVNSLSPDAHQATTPRDLLPQFKSVGGVYHPEEAKDIDTVEADAKKRRREEGVGEETARALSPGESKKRLKTRRTGGSQERRHLTGSTDFVKRFGLTSLYDEFVRPYVGGDGQVRRKIPDLASSHYLRGVEEGAVARGGSLDLVGLVRAPPKSEFSHLELLPMASIRAAFAIGAGEQSKQTLKVCIGNSLVALFKQQRSPHQAVVSATHPKTH